MVATMLPVPAVAEETDTPVEEIGMEETGAPVEETGTLEEESQGIIVAFVPLEETERTVAPGTSLEDLDLPKTLTVTVQTAAPAEEEDDAASADEDTSMSDEASGKPVDDTENSDGDTSAPDHVSAEPADGYGAASPAEETGETTRTIPVTWVSEPEYDGNTEGEYLFTPVIEGYTVSAELPQIKVTVEPTPAPTALGMLLGSTGSILSITVSTAEELMAAIPDIATNGTIYLTDDITLTETVTINHSRSFTIDLGGKTLNGGSNTCITHKGGGTLTIQNGYLLANTSSMTSATIQLDSSSGLMLKNTMVENNGYGIKSYSSGDVTIQGGKVKAGANAAISIEGRGNLDVSGATIEGHLYGIRIYNATTPTVTIGGGTYIRNYDSLGNAISASSSNHTLILKGCTIYSVGYYAVNSAFKIQGNSPVVLRSSGTSAASNAPDLSDYTGIIHASTNVDGSQNNVISAEVLNNNIKTYKYLAFAPANLKIRNATTNAFYDNLQSAVDEVQEGEIIDLVGNLTLAETVEIPAGDDRSFILNLNNNTLDGGGSGTSILHNGGGTLTIANRIRASAQTGTIKGSIDGTGRVAVAGPVVFQGAPAFNNANLVLDGVMVVKASTNPDGNTSDPYDESNLSSYQYLEFGFSFYAKIGDTGYTLLEHAVSAVQEGETIVLLENITLDATITIDKNFDFTLDLNGKTIELNKLSSPPILYTGPGKLTIDSSVAGGKIQAIGSSLSVVQIKCNTGNLTIRNCTLNGNYGIYFNAPQGFGNLDIINCTVNAYYGIYLYDSGTRYNIGAINISNSQIIRSDDSNSGTTRYGINYSYVTMEGINLSDSTISGFEIGIGNDYGTKNTVTVSGHTVIQGTNRSSSRALSNVNLQLNGVKVIKASKNYNGTLPEAYDESKITAYKYLEFDTAVAQIGSTYYKTLQDAIDAVKNGETIQLLSDLDLDAEVTIPGTNSYSFTLNLNGHKLESNGLGIIHNGTGKLTINGGGGKIIVHSGSSIVVDAGSLTVNEVTIISNNYCGISFTSPQSDCSLTVIDCDVIGEWIGIYAESPGTMTISGGSVSHTDMSLMNNAAIVIKRGQLNISGCEITGLQGLFGRPGSGANPTINISGGTIIRAQLSAIWDCDVIISGPVTLQANLVGSNFSILTNGTLTLQRVLVARASNHSDGTLPDDPYDAERLTKYQYVEFASIPSYTITYAPNGGSGSMAAGTAREGEFFQLPENGFTAPDGKRFVAWAIGDSSGPQVSAGESYTFTADTTVYAIWEDIPTYTITATAGAGGSISPSGSVTVNHGDSQTFTITPNSGYSIADVKVDNASQGKITSYTFDNVTADHTISVTFSYNGGSSGSRSSDDDDDDSSSGSGSSSTNVAPLVVMDEPNAPAQGETTVSGTVDSSGNLTVNLTSQAVTNALNQALAQAKKNGNQNGVVVVIRVKAGNTAGNVTGNVTVNLPKAVQETIIQKQIIQTIIVVDNPDIQVGLDLATVKEINRQAKSDVHITATRRSNSTLSGDARNAIGNRPTFELTASYGSGRQVQNFGNGSVTVTIPYTLGATESAGNLMAVYVDGNGKVHWLTHSVYDSEAKVLRFTTNHFSTYGVGYKQGNTFTDTATHWAKDDIDFAVSRGLLNGTATTSFSPDAAITRGALVAALGRLADVNVSGYQKSSFSDVKQGAYYLGYIEWANQSNILKGSNGKFSPEEGVTREQLAVILQNYAKATGFTLPKVQVENTFADSGKISSSARDAVKQVQMAGVLSSKQNNRFDPKGTVTRAEFAAVLRRLVERKLSGETMQGWIRNDAGQWMYFQNGKPVAGKKVIGGKTYTFDPYGITAEDPRKAKAGVSSGTYTVQQGDSFWLIARKAGCTIEELEQLNGKKRTDLIHPGDILLVPEK